MNRNYVFKDNYLDDINGQLTLVTTMNSPQYPFDCSFALYIPLDENGDRKVLHLARASYVKIPNIWNEKPKPFLSKLKTRTKVRRVLAKFSRTMEDILNSTDTNLKKLPKVNVIYDPGIFNGNVSLEARGEEYMLTRYKDPGRFWITAKALNPPIYKPY